MGSAVVPLLGKPQEQQPTNRRIAKPSPQVRTADTILRQDQIVNVLEIISAEAIEQGLSAGDIYRLVDQALINKAIVTFGRSQQKPNQSQIAAQTGLTRPEVRSLVARLGGDRTKSKTVRRNKVAQTHEYLAKKHLAPRTRMQPFTVRYEGKGHSFSNAVRAVGGDIPPAAMLKEFSRRGLVKIIRRNLKPQRLEISPEFNLNERSLEFCLAIGVNKAAKSTGESQDRGTYLFETVCYSELAVRQFARLLEEKVPAFLEALGTAHIYAKNKSSKRSKTPARHLRVAIIYWNENSEN